jgi:hypothetical protein
MFNLIPLPYRILAFVAIILGLCAGAYIKGKQSVQEKWEAEKIIIAKEISDLKAKQSAVTTEVVIKHVDRVKVIKEEGEKVIEYIDRVITVVDEKACTITPNIIDAHNAAVIGKIK